MRFRRFQEQGFVHLPKQLTATDCDTLRTQIWARLDPQYQGESLSRPSVTTSLRLPLHALTGALRPGPETHSTLLGLGTDPMFDGCEAALSVALEQVFSPREWMPAPEIGRLLMPAFPMSHSEWTVPSSAWHADEPTFLDRESPMGLLAFVFLDSVAPRGGGTVTLSGSPRLLQQLVREAVDEGKPAVLQCHEALKRLREEEPLIADLLSDAGTPEVRTQRYMNEAFLCRGISLRVEELTGNAGDIVLMDPRALHTISPNCTDRVRLVLKLCAQSG